MLGQVQGLFWNYYSLGMDAKAAYGFHSLREKRPWAASGRMINQAWYAYFSCSSGWFCAAQPLRNKLTLKVHPLNYDMVRKLSACSHHLCTGMTVTMLCSLHRSPGDIWHGLCIPQARCLSC